MTLGTRLGLTFDFFIQKIIEECLMMDDLKTCDPGAYLRLFFILLGGNLC